MVVAAPRVSRSEAAAKFGLPIGVSDNPCGQFVGSEGVDRRGGDMGERKRIDTTVS